MFLALTNNFKANVVVFCKSLFVYLFGGPDAKAEAEIEVKA